MTSSLIFLYLLQMKLSLIVQSNRECKFLFFVNTKDDQPTNKTLKSALNTRQAS